MATDYWSGGPYEASVETILEMMTRRIAPLGKGKPVAGIPFTEPDPHRRTLTILNLDTGAEATARIGKAPYTFSQQSMSKPSAACYAMHLLGVYGLQRFQQELGNQFSGRPYNGVNLLRPGVPYNYSDNIGALKVWKLIVNNSKDSDPFNGFYKWFCGLTGTTTPSPNYHMAEGEYAEEGQNWRLLEELGIRQGTQEWRDVYYSYCRACAIKVTTIEAANVFGTIANNGKNPVTSRQVVPVVVAQHVYYGMSQHGAYDESLRYYLKAGLHSKTGVDGGIMGQITAHPRMVFCGHHSDLNFAGNSGEVLKWIVDLASMRLEWPGSGVATYKLPPNVPSGAALDELLRRLMKPTTLSALQAALAAHIEANEHRDDGRNIYTRKSGFYLKLNPKNKPIEEESALLTEGTDIEGVLKRYWFMPDNHNLHKIVVERANIGWRQNLHRKVDKSLQKRFG